MNTLLAHMFDSDFDGGDIITLLIIALLVVALIYFARRA